MTDEEKAKEITIKHFEITEYCFENLLLNKDFVYNFYNGVLKGLAEGRKEKQTIIDTQTVQIESRDVYLSEKENIILRQQSEIEQLKKQIEKMKCCENCKKHRNAKCTEDEKFYARTTKHCDKWEYANNEPSEVQELIDSSAKFLAELITKDKE